MPGKNYFSRFYHQSLTKSKKAAKESGMEYDHEVAKGIARAEAAKACVAFFGR